MDRYRFLVPAITPGSVALPPAEAHHALRVLRLESGAPVQIFDGHGSWADGLLQASKKSAEVEIQRVIKDPPPQLQLTIATAVPKGDRAEWLIEQVSQLNAAQVQWLDCDRGVVKPKEGGGKLEKWQRLACESAKQCGRNHLLKIHPLQSLEQVVQEAQDLRGGEKIIWWLEPRHGIPVREAYEPLVPRLLNGQTVKLYALIGPEGGWSPREVELLEGIEQIEPVKLTPTILRIETACAAIAAIVG